MQLLVTYFEPFGGEAKNASAQAAALLPEMIGNRRITKCCLPVVFGLAGERCCALIADACRQRGLTQSGADFLDPVARDIQSRIQDPQLRALPVLLG